MWPPAYSSDSLYRAAEGGGPYIFTGPQEYPPVGAAISRPQALLRREAQGPPLPNPVRFS